MAALRSLFALVALLSVRVLAQCVSYGIDYANGGQYYIDASSNQYFSFVTVFQGCNQEDISPVLMDPNDNIYSCSSISTQPSGVQVTSTCGIPFSAMKSGTWKVILAGEQVQVQRTLELTVGLPETTTVTATPTIILGITSTPRAITVQSTIQQTVTLILVPSTVSRQCNGQTQTVTSYQGQQTVTVVSTVVRTETQGQVTSYWGTTLTSQASCHYPTSASIQDFRFSPRAETSPSPVNPPSSSPYFATPSVSRPPFVPDSPISLTSKENSPISSSSLSAEPSSPPTTLRTTRSPPQTASSSGDSSSSTTGSSSSIASSSSQSPISSSSRTLPPFPTIPPIPTRSVSSTPSSTSSTSSTRTSGGGQFCIGNACSGWGLPRRSEKRSVEESVSNEFSNAEKRSLHDRAEAAVAAQTVTYTQTTFTVTQTVVTTVPPRTTTELVARTTTATVQPPAQTVCANGGRVVTITLNPNGGQPTTQTNLVYSTTRLSGTVWVGQTQYSTISNPASATACWRAGGWYGAA